MHLAREFAECKVIVLKDCQFLGHVRDNVVVNPDWVKCLVSERGMVTLFLGDDGVASARIQDIEFVK